MKMDTKWTHKDNKKTRNLVYQVFRVVKSDLDWIQTSNLLSRNEMRYSVAPRGRYKRLIISCSMNLFAGANIVIFV